MVERDSVKEPLCTISFRLPKAVIAGLLKGRQFTSLIGPEKSSRTLIGQTTDGSQPWSALAGNFTETATISF